MTSNASPNMSLDIDKTEKKMNILITVCARGGSKGVKNKNIRLLAGRPLLAYTIKLAKKWGKAQRIVCSTDSEEIAKVAKEYGAEVPFKRPAELATDTAGKLDVIRHALQECEKTYGEKYNLIVDLDATAPLRSLKDLDGCLRLFEEKKPDLVISAVEARRNPYFNQIELNEEGWVRLSKDLGRRILCRQDAPKVYDLNASIYFYDRNFLLNPQVTSPLSTKKAALYIMEEISAVDIDQELDFKYIEFLIKEKVVNL